MKIHTYITANLHDIASIYCSSKLVQYRKNINATYYSLDGLAAAASTAVPGPSWPCLVSPAAAPPATLPPILPPPLTTLSPPPPMLTFCKELLDQAEAAAPSEGSVMVGCRNEAAHSSWRDQPDSGPEKETKGETSTRRAALDTLHLRQNERYTRVQRTLRFSLRYNEF